MVKYLVRGFLRNIMFYPEHVQQLLSIFFCKWQCKLMYFSHFYLYSFSMASAMSSHCPLFGRSSFGTGGSSLLKQQEGQRHKILVALISFSLYASITGLK